MMISAPVHLCVMSAALRLNMCLNMPHNMLLNMLSSAPVHWCLTAPLQRATACGWWQALRQRGWAEALLQAAPRLFHPAVGPAGAAAAWHGTLGWTG
jgi:hypothetical protein